MSNNATDVTSGLIIASLAGVLLGCQSGPRAIEAPPASTTTQEALYAPGDYYVDHIVDGDTLWLRKDTKTIKVRMLRVDAPERDQFGYQEATEELQRQLGDESQIRLEFEDERIDPHGRTLAYLFVDGKNVNLEMVRSGWSPFFDRYGKGRYDKDFEAAEVEARHANVGIWANPSH